MNNKAEKLQHKRYTATVLELVPPTERDFVLDRQDGAGYSIFLNMLRKVHRQVSHKAGDSGMDCFAESQAVPLP